MKSNVLEVIAVESAQNRASIVECIRQAFAADDKADKARATAREDGENSKSALKVAAAYFAQFYPTLEDMMSEKAEADIKGAIAESLPARMRDAYAKRDAKLIKTPTQLLQPGVSKAEQAQHMAWKTDADNFVRYQTIYLGRIRDYAFPAEVTPFTRAQKAVQAAFKAHVALGKKGLPATITPAQFSASKAALVELGKLYGLELQDKAKA